MFSCQKQLWQILPFVIVINILILYIIWNNSICYWRISSYLEDEKMTAKAKSWRWRYYWGSGA